MRIFIRDGVSSIHSFPIFLRRGQLNIEGQKIEKHVIYDPPGIWTVILNIPVTLKC